jgi:hypothetical protein
MDAVVDGVGVLVTDVVTDVVTAGVTAGVVTSGGGGSFVGNIVFEITCMNMSVAMVHVSTKTSTSAIIPVELIL